VLRGKKQSFYFKRAFVLLHNDEVERARKFYKCLDQRKSPTLITYLNGMSMGSSPEKPLGKNNYDQMITVFNELDLIK